jgi:2-C-methyl-D-erythritol 4-phosphate cytidylyltransferase
VEVAGRPLIAWSLDSLAEAELIGPIVIAAPPGHEDEIAALADEAVVVTGAGSRSGSVRSALERVKTDLVVVHDAARPLAPAAMFDEVTTVLGAQPRYDAVIAAAPVADTLKRASTSDLRVRETLEREGLWAVQTPQAFRAAALREGLAVADHVLEEATDDAALVEAAGGRVRVHPADDPNPKVTSSPDLELVSALLAARGY